MFDPTTLGSSLAILAVLVVLGWFAVGTQRNIRKGNDTLRRLQEGLPLVAGRARLKWLGSSVVQLDLTDTRQPFREAAVLVILEPRDVGILWAWGRARARRDMLILRARLDEPPRYELEAGDARTWTGGQALAKLDRESWNETTWGEVQVAHTSGADLAAATRSWQDLMRAAGGVWRLSIRRQPPHLEVHLSLTSELDPPALFTAFRQLALDVR